MTRGKRTCKILKEIRQQIADNNDIEYVTSECHFQGECKGTCPKCEAEVKYLEKELAKRRQLGKVVTIAGISLGVAGSFSACNAPREKESIALEAENSIERINSDTVDIDTISTMPIEVSRPIIDIIGDVVIEDGLVIDVGGIEEEENTIDTIVPIEEDYEEYYEEEDNLFMGIVQETEPQFPGGEIARVKFFEENLVYPKEAKEKRIEGRIIVGFVVETDGSITNVEVIRGNLGYGCEEEAIRVVKMMPKWKPGEQRGKKVRVKYNLPIQFILDKNEK